MAVIVQQPVNIFLKFIAGNIFVLIFETYPQVSSNIAFSTDEAVYKSLIAESQMKYAHQLEEAKQALHSPDAAQLQRYDDAIENLNALATRADQRYGEIADEHKAGVPHSGDLADLHNFSLETKFMLNVSETDFEMLTSVHLLINNPTYHSSDLSLAIPRLEDLSSDHLNTLADLAKPDYVAPPPKSTLHTRNGVQTVVTSDDRLKYIQNMRKSVFTSMLSDLKAAYNREIGALRSKTAIEYNRINNQNFKEIAKYSVKSKGKARASSSNLPGDIDPQKQLNDFFNRCDYLMTQQFLFNLYFQRKNQFSNSRTPFDDKLNEIIERLLAGPHTRDAYLAILAAYYDPAMADLQTLVHRTNALGRLARFAKDRYDSNAYIVAV